MVPIPPFAVHVADGVLTWPWLAAGFALAGVLALLAAWRVREEDVPRIALLTAAFFVASSIHVKLGPSSVHLLLNGLVGVVLGLRAPLAILVGVTLQAALIPHGGFSTIGVNTCTEAIPALLAGWIFGLLHSVPWTRHGIFRALLVAASAATWGASLIFALVVLATNPLGELVRTHNQAGLVLSALHVESAWRVLGHPLTLALLALLAAGCAWGERRMGNAPEFPLGLLVGVFSVLSTTALTGLVLLADGADRWHTFVNVVFLAHLPLAVVEGLILGCVVGFLARVKPEMLAAVRQQDAAPSPPGKSEHTPPALPLPQSAFDKVPALLLALGALLLSPGPARAHRLEADYDVDLAHKKVTIESFYETDDVPKNATVRVTLPDGSTLAEGPLDGKGKFAFSYDTPQRLRVVVNAPGGHRAELIIPAWKLGGREDRPVAASADSRGRDLVVGVGFVLALASFVLSLLNARRLRALSAHLPGGSTSSSGTSH
jgi:cobalt/nickel transport system permease protein